MPTPEQIVPIHQTASGIEFVRTPEERFRDLHGFAFEARYADIGDLRMSYVEAGPPDGEVVLLMHGQPTWSYREELAEGLNRFIADNPS